ncbi:MAG: site-specific DNA-methyltransferase [Candidatus Melainabacteria bacterium]|nr:site-specific DNA-methyltransferase [Candidatus Melainabacteria bacterium]
MLKTKTREPREDFSSLKGDLLKIVDPGDISIDSYPSTSSHSLKNTWRQNPRNWGHPMHSMASRSGSFPPALADYFISNFSKIGDLVLDPYSGKGTAPYQACLLDRIGFGVDVTPEAYVLTGAKVHTIKHEEAVEYLKSIKFNISKTNIKDVHPDVKVFFSTKTLAQILVIKERLLEDLELGTEKIDYINGNVFHQAKTKKEQCAQYWLGILTGILHGSSSYSLSLPCSHSFSMAPNYTKKYAKEHDLKKPDRNVKECMIEKSYSLQSAGIPRVSGKAYLGKAQELPDSWEEKFDLIVTSPPYFTAQSYAWDNWLREWLLGFDFKEVRKQTTQTASYEKYSQAMYEFLKEAHRVLKRGKRAFVIVGDVTKKSGNEKIIIKTSNVITTEAKKAGFEVDLIINDDIPPTKRYNSSFLTVNQGLQIDRIVCLRKN